MPRGWPERRCTNPRPVLCRVSLLAPTGGSVATRRSATRSSSLTLMPTTSARAKHPSLKGRTGMPTHLRECLGVCIAAACRKACKKGGCVQLLQCSFLVVVIVFCRQLALIRFRGGPAVNKLSQQASPCAVHTHRPGLCCHCGTAAGALIFDQHVVCIYACACDRLCS